MDELIEYLDKLSAKYGFDKAEEEQVAKLCIKAGKGAPNDSTKKQDIDPEEFAGESSDDSGESGSEDDE